MMNNETKDDMNIAFCINNNYIHKVAVVMTSILENNYKRWINFYIFSSDINDENLDYLKRLHIKYKNFSLKKILVSIDKFSKLNLTIDYISIETYYRYIIAESLPSLNKILYLDADLIINGDITDLYNTDLSSYLLAGAEDLFIKNINYKKQINFSDDVLYINAGVLLMNLQEMRKADIFTVFINRTLELGKKIKFQDQDIINIVCKGKIKRIDSKYNFAMENIKKQKLEIKTATIIHYTGNNKPWNTNKIKLRKIWAKYNKLTEKILNRKIKVGLIIDEFFGGAGTAYGGYGFLARKYICKYIPDKNIQVDVLLGKGKRYMFAEKFHEDNVDLYRLPRIRFFAKRWLRKQKYDIYLSIELTDDYVLKHETNKNKKLILWIQDPRPKYEWDEIETVELYKETNYYNQLIYDLVHDWNRKGRVKFISQGYFLNSKAKDLYNLPYNTPIQYVPNPIEMDNTFDVNKHNKKDNIIFLGRIASVKRGWLFCEIAKRMPNYQFYLLGQSFREKEKNESIMSQYLSIPNLHFVGHVDGNEKTSYLKDAKILVNCSIHEALPISFLEALSYGVCLVSNRNPEELISKFGIFTGQINGNGFDKINLFINAIKKLMDDDSLRESKSKAGIEYVRNIHSLNNIDVKDIIYMEL